LKYKNHLKRGGGALPSGKGGKKEGEGLFCLPGANEGEEKKKKKKRKTPPRSIFHFPGERRKKEKRGKRKKGEKARNHEIVPYLIPGPLRPKKAMKGKGKKKKRGSPTALLAAQEGEKKKKTGIRGKKKGGKGGLACRFRVNDYRGKEPRSGRKETPQMTRGKKGSPPLLWREGRTEGKKKKGRKLVRRHLFLVVDVPVGEGEKRDAKKGGKKRKEDAIRQGPRLNLYKFAAPTVRREKTSRGKKWRMPLTSPLQRGDKEVTRKRRS